MNRHPSLARAAAALGALVALGGCEAPRPDVPRANTARWVLRPSAIASLSSAHDTLGVPERIFLGDPFGRSALYLKFPRDWSGRGQVVKAFITLTPSDVPAGASGAISVEAWRVSSDWQPHALRAWSDKPPLAPPSASTSITAGPPHELRIDVTELVRFAAANPERDFGVALLTPSGTGQGAAFATGMAGGNAPRLEVYLAGAR